MHKNNITLPLTHLLDYADYEIFARILLDTPRVARFDSGRQYSEHPPQEDARYSFVAFDPFKIFVDDGLSNPFERVKAELEKYKSVFESHQDPESLPPFCGGFAGVFAYECAGHLEKITLPVRDEKTAPAFFGGLYDTVLYADHLKKEAGLLSTGFPETAIFARRKHAESRLEAARIFLKQKAENFKPVTYKPIIEAFTCNFTRDSYQTAVSRIIEYIRAGDIFQANISRRLRAEKPKDFNAPAFYTRLCSVNPAPFGFYFDAGDYQICSASPERFIKIDDDLIETRPIKGTRRKTGDPAEDLVSRAELENSVKDRAENIMIADLLRNDLSKQAVTGSVSVKKLCALEEYQGLFHLVTHITAQRLPKAHPCDILRDCFPGGSITGAPKIRATEIIAETEGVARGAYCGVAAYIGFDGRLDSNILIRTVTVSPRDIVFHTGGGITTLSDPEEEYVETEIKMRYLVKALCDAPATGQETDTNV